MSFSSFCLVNKTSPPEIVLIPYKTVLSHTETFMIVARHDGFVLQWSFGILLWELCTRGSDPLPDVDNHLVKEFYESGQRLPKTAHINDEL